MEPLNGDYIELLKTMNSGTAAAAALFPKEMTTFTTTDKRILEFSEDLTSEEKFAATYYRDPMSFKDMGPDIIQPTLLAAQKRQEQRQARNNSPSSRLFDAFGLTRDSKGIAGAIRETKEVIHDTSGSFITNAGTLMVGAWSSIVDKAQTFGSAFNVLDRSERLSEAQDELMKMDPRSEEFKVMFSLVEEETNELSKLSTENPQPVAFDLAFPELAESDMWKSFAVRPEKRMESVKDFLSPTKALPALGGGFGSMAGFIAVNSIPYAGTPASVLAIAEIGRLQAISSGMDEHEAAMRGALYAPLSWALDRFGVDLAAKGAVRTLGVVAGQKVLTKGGVVAAKSSVPGFVKNVSSYLHRFVTDPTMTQAALGEAITEGIDSIGQAVLVEDRKPTMDEFLISSIVGGVTGFGTAGLFRKVSGRSEGLRLLESVYPGITQRFRERGEHAFLSTLLAETDSGTLSQAAFLGAVRTKGHALGMNLVINKRAEEGKMLDVLDVDGMTKDERLKQLRDIDEVIYDTLASAKAPMLDDFADPNSATTLIDLYSTVYRAVHGDLKGLKPGDRKAMIEMMGGNRFIPLYQTLEELNNPGKILPLHMVHAINGVMKPNTDIGTRTGLLTIVQEALYTQAKAEGFNSTKEFLAQKDKKDRTLLSIEKAYLSNEQADQFQKLYPGATLRGYLSWSEGDPIFWNPGDTQFFIGLTQTATPETVLHELTHFLVYRIRPRTTMAKLVEGVIGKPVEEWSGEDHEAFVSMAESYFFHETAPTVMKERAAFEDLKLSIQKTYGVTSRLAPDRISADVKAVLDNFFFGDAALYIPVQELVGAYKQFTIVPTVDERGIIIPSVPYMPPPGLDVDVEEGTANLPAVIQPGMSPEGMSKGATDFVPEAVEFARQATKEKRTVTRQMYQKFIEYVVSKKPGYALVPGVGYLSFPSNAHYVLYGLKHHLDGLDDVDKYILLRGLALELNMNISAFITNFGQDTPFTPGEGRKDQQVKRYEEQMLEASKIYRKEVVGTMRSRYQGLSLKDAGVVNDIAPNVSSTITGRFNFLAQITYERLEGSSITEGTFPAWVEESVSKLGFLEGHEHQTRKLDPIKEQGFEMISDPRKRNQFIRQLVNYKTAQGVKDLFLRDPASMWAAFLIIDGYEQRMDDLFLTLDLEGDMEEVYKQREILKKTVIALSEINNQSGFHLRFLQEMREHTTIRMLQEEMKKNNIPEDVYRLLFSMTDEFLMMNTFSEKQMNELIAAIVNKQRAGGKLWAFQKKLLELAADSGITYEKRVPLLETLLHSFKKNSIFSALASQYIYSNALSNPARRPMDVSNSLATMLFQAYPVKLAETLVDTGHALWNTVIHGKPLKRKYHLRDLLRAPVSFRTLKESLPEAWRAVKGDLDIIDRTELGGIVYGTGGHNYNRLVNSIGMMSVFKVPLGEAFPTLFAKAFSKVTNVIRAGDLLVRAQAHYLFEKDFLATAERWKADGTYETNMRAIVEPVIDERVDKGMLRAEHRDLAVEKAIQDPTFAIKLGSEEFMNLISFQSELGTIGRNLQNFVQAGNEKLGKPFGGIPVVSVMAMLLVRTPLNLMKYGARFAPLATGVPGVAGVFMSRYGWGDSVGKIVANQIVAHGLMTMIVGMLENGIITGEWPEDEEEKDFWNRHKIRPYSFAMSFGDKVEYYPLPAPLDYAIVPIINSYKAMKQAMLDEDDTSFMQHYGAGLYSTWKYYINNGFMRDVSMITSTGGGEEKRIKRYFASKVNLFVPFSAALRYGQQAYNVYKYGEDPVKQPESFLEYVKEGIPGLRGQVPDKVSYFGKTITRTQLFKDAGIKWPMGWILPMRDPSWGPAPTGVEKEFQRLELYPAAFQTHVTVAGIPIELSKEQHLEASLLYGELVMTNFNKLMSMPFYKGLSDERKAILLNDKLVDYRAMVRKRLLRAHPELVKQGIAERKAKIRRLRSNRTVDGVEK